MKSLLPIATLASWLLFVQGFLSAQEPEPTLPTGKAKFSEEILRLQIFLDRHLFAPGKLDGLPGEFTLKALQRYQWTRGMPLTDLADHSIDLAASVPELESTYTIREEDLRFVGDVPTKPAEQSRKKYLPYGSLRELVAERFHCSVGLLRVLNSPTPAPSLDADPADVGTDLDPAALDDASPATAIDIDRLQPGDVVTVPNVEPFRIEDMTTVPSLPEVPAFRSRVIQIDTRERMLDVYASSCGPLLASFPITPGSGHLRTPPGFWKITGITLMPTFRWDESVLEYGVRSDQYYSLPIGPNNPVGVLWAGLNKPGIGVHGTNHPETIGRAASHGCMRTANWDAARLARMITKGMPVIIEGPEADPRPKPPAARPPAPAPAPKPLFWWMQPKGRK